MVVSLLCLHVTLSYSSLSKLKHSFFTLSFLTGEDLRVFSSSYLVATSLFVLCVCFLKSKRVPVYNCVSSVSFMGSGDGSLSLIICWDPLLLFCWGLLEPSACGSSAVVSECAHVCACWFKEGRPSVSLCSLPLPFILKHTPTSPNLNVYMTEFSFDFY